MATKVSVEYCGMPGEGRTVKEAKQDAARKLESLVKDVQRKPRTIVVGDACAVIYRSATGWNILQVSNGGLPRTEPSEILCNETLEELVPATVQHLAQNKWSHDVVDDAEFIGEALRANRVPTIDAIRAIDEFVRWTGFQRMYKHAKDAGKTDAEAHEIVWRG